MSLDLRNMDCMELMKQYADNYFDLAICDPPYGIGVTKMQLGIRKGKGKKQNRKYDWDNETPNADYFKQLFRVSKNQIIWGANYFLEHLGNTRCMLTWDKMQEFSGSDFELAWTSFDSPAKTFRLSRIEAHGNGVIHPTQKPIRLYKFCLENYAKQGDKILDTHLGSGSSAIACHDYKFDLVACEIDKEYYNKAMERIKNHTAQTTLF